MYNNHGLFRWNHNNKMYWNHTHDYTDVYVHTGTVVDGEWENCVAVKYVNDIPMILSNSNHFIHAKEWPESYNAQYKIFDNIVRNYYEITENKKPISEEFYNDETYFCMIDAFLFSNSGHNLSVLLDQINFILINNIKNILILKNYRSTHNFRITEHLLVDCNIIEIDINSIYRIKNVWILYPEIFNIFKHMYLIEKIRKYAIENYLETYKHCCDKNLILMKTNRNQKVMLQVTQIQCENFLLNLESKGWVYIYPEKLNPFELCIYLLFARKIVFSTGSILYTNKILFNHMAKLIYIRNNSEHNCHDGLHNLLTINVSTGNLDHIDYINIIRQIEEY